MRKLSPRLSLSCPRAAFSRLSPATGASVSVVSSGASAWRAIGSSPLAIRDAARSETPASDRSLRFFVAKSAAAAFSADRDDELDDDDDDDALEDERDMSPMDRL